MPTLDCPNSPPTALSDDVTRTPCFFSQVCRRRTAVEKAGRSVCAECAKRLRGFEYPSRDPTADPSYPAHVAEANAPELAFDVSEELPDVSDL
jgi:hypothetical protein